MPIVRAEKLAKCFRIYRHPSDHLKELLSFGKRRHHEAFWAVKDVDVSIDRGICLGIIGENGSGKSTLLRMIAGVVRPTSGKVEVGGRVSALLELGAGFNPQFTGRENIYLYASILGFSDAQTRERIPSIEKFAEIGEFVGGDDAFSFAADVDDYFIGADFGDDARDDRAFLQLVEGALGEQVLH